MSEKINWASISSVLDQTKGLFSTHIIEKFFEGLTLSRDRELFLKQKWEKTKGDLGWFISSLRDNERDSLYEYLDDRYKDEGN